MTSPVATSDSFVLGTVVTDDPGNPGLQPSTTKQPSSGLQPSIYVAPTTHTGSAEISSLLAKPTPTDSASFSDSSSLQPNMLVNDSGSLTDTASVFVTLSRTDSATEFDTSSGINFNNQIVASDSGSLTDGSAYTANQLATDTSSLTETSSYTNNPSTTDFGLVTEISSPFANLSTTDSSSTTDVSSLAITTFINTVDSATFSEGSSLTVIISTSDSATQTDNTTGKTFGTTDSSTLSESRTYTSNLATTDTAVFTDVNNGINFNNQIVASDGAVTTESSNNSSITTTADSLTLSENRTLTDTSTASDSATVTEQTSRVGINSTDSSTFTNNSTINQPRTEIYVFSESSVLSINAADTASLSNTSQPINVNTQDVATLTNQSNYQAWTTTQEAFVLDDGINVFKPISSPNGDSATFFEQAFVDILPRYTEDIVIYNDSKLPNREFRVIAQDHFTREFIHWDLPLDSVKVTYSLTGPNLLIGRISSEMESIMSLDPPLTPNRTWLHLEEDGEIRGSFLLTPFVDAPANQVRQIEAEGFSAYPHWVYYEDNPYTGIQVDPSDMIRKLWDHVQSYTDGNLGVQVSSTKTPIKLGEPPEQVAFTTNENVSVSFQAGPYTLNYWSVTNCGDEIDKLCKETPMDYLEFSYWNTEKNDVRHKLLLGYPRLGTKRTDLVFREGENLAQLIPSYQGTNDNYASDVVIIGAGTGPSAVRAIASKRIGLLRKVNVIQNQDITNHARAQSIADFELKRISHSRFLIENITVDLTHPNAPWGSFAPGDDILIDCTVLYVGHVQAWYRIISYIYDPYQKTATINLSPSDSFTYGAEIVNPYDELPTAGFATLASQQDFTNLFSSSSQTVQLSQLQAYVTQLVQQIGCTYFNKSGLNNGTCVYWWWIVDHPQGANTLPQPGATVGSLDVLADPNNTMIIGKTDSGHILTGDNIVLIAQDGTIGQQTNSQSDIVYPNPYYVPQNGNGTGNPVAKVEFVNPNPQVADIIQHAVDYFNQNGLQNDHCLVYNSVPALLLLDSYSIWQNNTGYTFLIGRNIAGGLDYGNGVTVDNPGTQPNNMQFAAAYILQRIQSGQPLYEDWSWDGEPFVVSQYNDTLFEKYSGYHNMPVTQFLSAIILGQIT